MSSTYKTTPDLTDKMPPGIPYIVGNELAERFSYYGMRTILVVFMTRYMLDAHGNLATMSEPVAKSVYHLFVLWTYGLGIMGALLSDGWLGKYRTIIWLSLVYCAGHVALSLPDTSLGMQMGVTHRLGLFMALPLIAIGAGGIKPCVSAHVGDQFGIKNQHLLPRVFSWFYFAINVGAVASSLLTPVLLTLRVEGRWLADLLPGIFASVREKAFVGGPWLAFGLPGALMFLATFIFWLGRKKFVHIPAGGLGFLKESLSPQGLWILARLSIIFLFVVPFWALFDQTGSAWVLQANHMAREIPLGSFSVEILPSQIQAVNPFLILVFIPLFSYVVYPTVAKVIEPTPMRKIATGLFMAGFAFMISAWIETRIGAGQSPHIIWQVVAYIILTMAEVLVSITCLEFAYTQSPPKMKSLVMSLFLASVALGNALVFGINAAIAAFSPPADSGKPMLLDGAAYYWLFTGMMLGTAVLFLFVVWLYQPKTYIQGDKDAAAE